jgi:S-adenosylmethionine-diacylglycerol 3-amino-3-carboxypropyl transferase
MKTRVFEGLNYSFGNEDNCVETELLEENTRQVVSVCHSGSQLIPFLTRKPSAITFVDVSEEQLVIAALRLHLLQRLSHDEFLRFWGYPPHDGKTLEAFRKEAVQDFNDRDQVRAWMSQGKWQEPLYLGKWERTAAKLSKLYRFLLGQRGLGLFDCKTLEHQHQFLRNDFPRNRWKLLVKAVSVLAASYAYINKQSIPPATHPKQLFGEYARIFDALLHGSIARDNFFFELLVFGRLKSAKPLEAQRSVYEQAQSWVSQCRVRFVRSDILDYIKQVEQRLDFVTLSNVPSYFTGAQRTGYLQEIRPALNNGGKVVARTFLSHAEPVLDGYNNQTSSARSVLSAECTQVYKISLYEKQPVPIVTPANAGG